MLMFTYSPQDTEFIKMSHTNVHTFDPQYCHKKINYIYIKLNIYNRILQ